MVMVLSLRQEWICYPHPHRSSDPVAETSEWLILLPVWMPTHPGGDSFLVVVVDSLVPDLLALIFVSKVAMQDVKLIEQARQPP